MVKGGDKLEARLTEMLDKLSNAEKVRVGFLEGSTYPDGTSTAMVAALNEYGHGIGPRPAAGQSDTRERVPPRPFFRNMIAAKQPGWGAQLGEQLKANDYDGRAALEHMGQGIKGQLQDSIVNGSFPPLKPSTIKRKGFDKPLIDSSHMVNSVDYEVI